MSNKYRSHGALSGTPDRSPRIVRLGDVESFPHSRILVGSLKNILSKIRGP